MLTTRRRQWKAKVEDWPVVNGLKRGVVRTSVTASGVEHRSGAIVKRASSPVAGVWPISRPGPEGAGGLSPRVFNPGNPRAKRAALKGREVQKD
jgi:hypothetical protein